VTHLPFIAAAYGVFVVIAVSLVVDAWARLGRAQRRLRAMDPREKTVGGGA
jgi:hypothetical protein